MITADCSPRGYFLRGKLDTAVDQERKLFVTFIAILLGFGALMVHSASITSRPSAAEQIFLSRHLTFVSLGLVAAIAAAFVPAACWQRIAPWFFWGTIALLILVLVPGVGARVNGAQRWINLGPVNLQPSELMKLFAVLYAADYTVNAGNTHYVASPGIPALRKAIGEVIAQQTSDAHVASTTAATSSATGSMPSARW